MKRLFGFMAVMVFCITTAAMAFAADAKKAPAKGAVTAAAPKMVSAPPPAMAPRKANFIVLSGAVTKIDNADPANIKLEVRNDVDGSVHTVQVTPLTNVTKVTDISEIKVGEPVRIMSRKIDEQEVAMGIMFGKIRRMPQGVKK